MEYKTGIPAIEFKKGSADRRWQEPAKSSRKLSANIDAAMFVGLKWEWSSARTSDFSDRKAYLATMQQLGWFLSSCG